MSEQREYTKTELLAAIERNWIALNAALGRLSEPQLTTIHDAQGWTVKDHIIHMTRWENSVVSFLRGLPRHVGLGVEEALYRDGPYDDINAVIHQQTRGLPLSEAMAQFQATHQQLLALLEPLTDADLHKPYGAYLRTAPDDSQGPPAIDLIYGNTADHFAEHLEWIEALVRESQG
jgi:hypothetical protein